MFVGGLSLAGVLSSDAGPVEETVQEDTSALDAQIIGQLESVMQSQKLYLRSDLTLSQLSRKMLVPIKQLSGAINRVTGENVSRYINKARITAAQQALLDGQTVTDAMLSSGFNTKSNFNREFARIAGMSPSKWLEAQD